MKQQKSNLKTCITVDKTKTLSFGLQFPVYENNKKLTAITVIETNI